MITPLTDVKHIPEVLAIAQELLPTRCKGVEDLLYGSLGDPRILVLLNVIDDKPTAYIIVYLTVWNSEKVAFIQSYASRKSTLSSSDRKEGWLLLSEWAKASGAKKIVGLTPLDTRVFTRYGFKSISTVIAKEV